MRRRAQILLLVTIALAPSIALLAESSAPKPNKWQYSAELLRPFWNDNVMRGESVLFINDAGSENARASVMFPIDKVISVHSSDGATTYSEGRDYQWQKGSAEIVIPVGSRIPSSNPSDLRRSANSQQYQLTHRDGQGEILFGPGLEYHRLQTCVTYVHSAEPWDTAIPSYSRSGLPRTISKLENADEVRLVAVGDSISFGLNASGELNGAPFQPAYPELVKLALEAHHHAPVNLTNLSISGKDTIWALSMVDKILNAKPDLVLIALGMNDASGRPVSEYQANIRAIIKNVRKSRPETEFILVASMLGNKNWTALKPELFPQYRDALAKLCGDGVALADVTSIWEGILHRKQDWDQTGNGVNHPNDFGHRVYAQVITSLLIPYEDSATSPSK